MKSILSEEDKLKLTIKKNYLERDAIKTKIINYLNRLSYLCSDDKDEFNRREKQKRGYLGDNLEGFPEFRIEKRPKLEDDETTVTRNRRLLQVGLFDHLRKAKDALEEEKSKKTIIKQQMQNKRVEQKLQEEKKNFEKSELDDIEKKIIAYSKDIKIINNQIKTDEGKLMKLTLINHYEKMKNYISTNYSPTIFWCPFKFNEKTEMLQKQTNNFIKKKIDAIKEANYEVNFEEEPWICQFQNLKEILRRKNESTQKDEVQAAGETDRVHITGETDDVHITGETDDVHITGETDDVHITGETDDVHITGETDDVHITGETDEMDEMEIVDDEDELEVLAELGKNISNESVDSYGHPVDETDMKEIKTDAAQNGIVKRDSGVLNYQKGNNCSGEGSKSSDEFFPDIIRDGEAEHKGGHRTEGVNEAQDANGSGETNQTNEIDETNQTNEIDETNQTNEIDETNQTNEIDETNETNEIDETNEANEAKAAKGSIVHANDAPGEDAKGGQKNMRKKKKGRPKRKGR
ncbi:hypothetical protein, conserved [Plasmodium gonderi]|uniref:Pinin/SDK/MemA protein domain-containing protein n=1 Tax=Plasmodium gonderi TaxID=77519 RepID=A0A1Y1JTW8_PLAGO|nr:hypothetical protein, conserved [Plasmodium gonderi]GAW83354.1 hypothetical protein, conserved [Plasmodium gonderi]